MRSKNNIVLNQVLMTWLLPVSLNIAGEFDGREYPSSTASWLHPIHSFLKSFPRWFDSIAQTSDLSETRFLSIADLRFFQVNFLLTANPFQAFRFSNVMQGQIVPRQFLKELIRLTVP